MGKDEPGYAEILQIFDLIEKSSRFGEFHLKVGDIEIDMSMRGGAAAPAPEQPAPAAAPQGGELSGELNLAQPAVQYPPGAVLVRSPMVGTFYRANEPGGKPFVDVGSRVTPDTTICIIEVMKLMNSIPAGASGVVTHILVNDARLVEAEQPLVVIDPAA